MSLVTPTYVTYLIIPDKLVAIKLMATSIDSSLTSQTWPPNTKPIQDGCH